MSKVNGERLEAANGTLDPPHAAVDTGAIHLALAAFAGRASGRVAHVEVLGQPASRTRHGDDVGYPAASLSKVPLAAAALLAGLDGTLDLSAPVPSSAGDPPSTRVCWAPCTATSPWVSWWRSASSPATTLLPRPSSNGCLPGHGSGR